MTEVGRLILRQRQTLSLSKMEIARRFVPTVSPQFIFNVEKGRCKLPIDRATQLCNILHIRPIELVEAFTSDFGLTIREKLGVVE